MKLDENLRANIKVFAVTSETYSVKLLIPVAFLILSTLSERTSASHRWPKYLLYVYFSNANQSETTRRPKEVKTVKAVVTAFVTGPWLEEYAKRTRPTENVAV